MTNSTSESTITCELKKARVASYAMATLTGETKKKIIQRFAEIIRENDVFLVQENQQDIVSFDIEKQTDVLLQRLKLDASKIQQLAKGIEDVANLEEPIGKVTLKTALDDGLILERLTVPLGVVGIIFESRPDVLPQILSLILKTGNAVVFKGGREAKISNAAFMTLVEKLNKEFPELPEGWAILLDSREAAQEMLLHPEYVDLIIPRGSNELVQDVMAKSKIPVLGHADGICHLYVHPTAHFEKAIPLIIDSKIQYPAACNALETLLVDETIAILFLPALEKAAIEAGITLIACERSQMIFTQSQPATDADWRTEYGDLRLAVKLVTSQDEAIQHINTYGSHHTDGILSEDAESQQQFLNAVDSANVYVNASTRFADGFRYGFGAEIGISTSKTHARGPVGIDGLLSYKYQLRGEYQLVKDYTGQNAKAFQHQSLL